MSDRSRPAGPRGGAVRLGVVLGAHGVRGVVRVKSFTARAEDVGAYGPLSDETGSQTFDVSVLHVAKGTALCRIRGVETRAAAETLRGAVLHVRRDALPDPEDDNEFYHSDLIGLTAVFPDGAEAGRVAGIHDFGAGDLLEIEGPLGEVAMVPFTRAAAPMIDLMNARVTVTPIPGLLEGPVAQSLEKQPPERRRRPPPGRWRANRPGDRPADGGAETAS